MFCEIQRLQNGRLPTPDANKSTGSTIYSIKFLNLQGAGEGLRVEGFMVVDKLFLFFGTQQLR